MRASASKRLILACCVTVVLAATNTACKSGESAQEDFKKDLTAVGLKVEGDITVDREKKTLGMAPVGFVAKPKPKTKTDSDTDSENESDPTSNSGKSKKNDKAATKAPTASSSPTSKSSKAPKTKEILEAIVKVKGSNKCNVELERSKNATGGKKVKDRDVQPYTIDEIVKRDGTTVAINSEPGVYNMNAIVAHLRNNAEWRTLCFA